jgi:hypothetical protein
MMARLLILLSIISVVFTCASCGFIKDIVKAEHVKKVLLKNPKSFIGTCFEVPTLSAITGAVTPETIWSLRTSAFNMRKGMGYKAALDPKLQDMVKQKYFDTGLLVDLNKAIGAYDAQSKLLLQIVDVLEERDEILLKVAVLNKKYV